MIESLRTELEGLVPGFEAHSVIRELDALSTRRALAADVPTDDSSAAEGVLQAALLTELLLAEGEVSDSSADLNDIAHALTQGMDLLRSPTPAGIETAQLSAALFSNAEQTPKAVAVLRSFGRLISAIERTAYASGAEVATLASLLPAYLASFLRRDLKALVRVAGHMDTAARAELFDADDSRLALVLTAFADQVDRAARSGPTPDDVSTLRGKLRLAHRIATHSANGYQVATVQRLTTSLESFLKNSTRLVISRARLNLPDSYVSELVGSGARHPILELWPPQREAVIGPLMRDPSLVVSMPTSAGKTLLAELRIAETLGRDPSALCVYIAPYNALAQQVKDKLAERLAPAGLADPQVWTGTYEIDASLESLGRVLVMTPEKLDSVMRSKLEDDPRADDLQRRLQLVVLDECHLIGTDGRGLTYELLVSRLRRRLPHVRLCAMSAVLGNPGSLAEWIADAASKMVQSDWRPGRARMLVYNRDGAVVDETKQTVVTLPKWSVAKKAAAKITAQLVNGGEWPVLVMDSQRGYAEDTARQIIQEGNAWDDGDEADERRARAANIAENLLGEESDLPKMLRAGVAFHHAGLPSILRAEIESMTRSRHLRVVASTTTLAEGVDLPFRVVVCPHINYESGNMSRQLFQNIAGRAGRAFSGIEGWVVFLEPGTVGLVSHLWNNLLGHGAEPLNVASWVAQLGRRRIKPADWHRDWRYQSQLLGLLGDGSDADDQVADYLARTFAAASLSAISLVPARRRGHELLARMEAVDPPLAAAASPYRLTRLGQAACLTGLSLDSVLAIRRELLHWAASGAWASSSGWAGTASSSLLEILVRLAFTPVEGLSAAIEMPGRYSLFSMSVQEWLNADNHELFDAVTEQDRPLLVGWLSGEDVRQMAAELPDPQPSVGPLRRKTELERVLDLNNYFSRIPGLLAWMYSGCVRMAEYMNEEGEADISEDVRLGVEYLKLGVCSPAAVFLTDTVGMPRTAATQLVQMLTFDSQDLEASLLTALVENGRDAARDLDVDDWTYRETLRAIRQFQPSAEGSDYTES